MEVTETPQMPLKRKQMFYSVFINKFLQIYIFIKSTKKSQRSPDIFVVSSVTDIQLCAR